MGFNMVRLRMMGLRVILRVVVIADICVRIDNMGHLCRGLFVAARYHYPWSIPVFSHICSLFPMLLGLGCHQDAC